MTWSSKNTKIAKVSKKYTSKTIQTKVKIVAKEVDKYCLNDEMYVIINIHWDNGWWGMFGDANKNVRKQAWKKFSGYRIKKYLMLIKRPYTF